MNQENNSEGKPLWQMVNEFCNVVLKSPEKFNPEIHVATAQRIAADLDERLRVSSHITMLYELPEYEVEGVLGEYIERIGEYVAIKLSNLFSYELVLDHFWKRNEAHLFGRKNPSIYIRYNENSKTISQIGRIIYNPIMFRMGILTIGFHNSDRERLWKR